MCDELARRGHVVRGLDLAATPAVADAVVADIADAAAVREAVRGMDAVVHLAAQPHDVPFPELVGPNVVGLYNVLDAARRRGRAPAGRRQLDDGRQRLEGFRAPGARRRPPPGERTIR